MGMPPLMIPLETLPAPVRPLLIASADPRRRLMIAKALLPMPPDQLLPCLAFLSQDSDREIAAAANKSLADMPQNLVLMAAESPQTHPASLDVFARSFRRNFRILEKVIKNRSTKDDTLLFLAEEIEGEALEMLAQNHQRILTCPRLVEVLYYNRSTPMATASALMELAVRNNLPVKSMPGYDEIAASILGHAPPGSTQPSSAPQADPPHATSVSEQEKAEILARAMIPEEESILAAQSQPLEATVEETLKEEPPEEAEQPEDRKKKAMLTDLLRDMKIPEKVRMALMGNNTARKLLAMDPNRLVASAVMRNPGLNDREIAGFARNRGVNEEIIHRIAENRELTKIYSIKLALVTNPRCPPHKAISFLKTLRDNDLKAISRSRDVPGHIARTAKRMIEERVKHPGK